DQLRHVGTAGSLDLNEVLARGQAGQRHLDLLDARRAARGGNLRHRLAGAIQQVDGQSGRRVARPVDRHANQQPIGPAELARADAPPVPLLPAAAATGTLGTRPRKYGAPSRPTAVSDTRDGASLPATSRRPGTSGTGSHTKVTFVLPFAPRDVPIHVWMMRAR